MKHNRERWVTNVYPLIDAGLRRKDCLEIIAAQGLPAPEKSACVFCPYTSDARFARLKAEYPADFAKAVAFDHSIRDGRHATMREQAYVHRSLKPLELVEFDPHGAAGQEDLFGNECEGHCGI